MTKPSDFDLVDERRFTLMIGACVGASIVSFVEVLDHQVVQFVLIAILMFVVVLFAYKSEVTRQQNESVREQTSKYLGVFTLKKARPDSAVALTKGLEMALRSFAEIEEKDRNRRR